MATHTAEVVAEAVIVVSRCFLDGRGPQPAREYGAENPRSAQSPLAVFEHPHGRFVHAGDPLK